MAYFPALSSDSILSSGLPYFTDIQASLRDESPTLLINVNTGDKVAHWTELDYSGERAPVGGTERKTLLIWPAEPLSYGTRYAVAIRSLRDATGELVAPSAAFSALRDGLPSPNPDVEGKRENFEELIEVLKASVVVDRSDLQLLWDFTTATKHALTNRLVHARDDALQRLETEFSYNITNIRDGPHEEIARAISGTFRVPFYLNRHCLGGTEDICSDVRLVMDADGNPQFQGYQEFDFEVGIPRSLTMEGASPGVLHQYGHGLLGSRWEIDFASELRFDADRFGWVLLATDWIGMSNIDTQSIIAMLSSDISDFAMLPDRSVQGVVNALYLMRLAKGPLSEDPAFRVGPGGRSVIDRNFGPSNPMYSGNSQGGIIGGVYMAASQDVTRGILGVPGLGYSMMMPRSSGTGSQLTSLIKARYPDPVDLMIVFHLLQMLWDRSEASGFMATVNGDVDARLPNTPPHQVFMHYSLGDSLVSWLSTYSQARSVNAVTFESNVKYEQAAEQLFGFDLAKDTDVVEGRSVMVGFEYEGVPMVDFRNLPPDEDFDTHEYTRNTEACRNMADSFLRTGSIRNLCGGPCVFEIPPLGK
jgi:hypothetical protein